MDGKVLLRSTSSWLFPATPWSRENRTELNPECETDRHGLPRRLPWGLSRWLSAEAMDMLFLETTLGHVSRPRRGGVEEYRYRQSVLFRCLD